MSKVYNVLLLTADPSDASRLGLLKEISTIRSYIQASNNRDSLNLLERHSIRADTIAQALHETAPQIIHFSGHGTKHGELCLEDAAGQTRPLAPEAIESLLELVRDEVVCVFLNSCYSAAQAEALAKGAKYVIGMNDAIGDQAAINFAGGFYRALGAGRTIEEAFQFGIVELKLLGIPGHQIPELIRDPKFTPRHVLVEKREIEFPGGEFTAVTPRMPGHAEISLDRNRSVFIDPLKYNSLGEMLDEVYLQYLSNQFPPLTYGEKWIIQGWGEAGESVAIAPIEWAEKRVAIHSLRDKGWQYTVTLQQQGVDASTLWRALELSERDKFIGLAIRSEWAAKLVASHPKGLYMIARDLTPVDIEGIDLSEYPHQLVLMDRWMEEDSPSIRAEVHTLNQDDHKNLL
jgi:hypothetical protein